MSIDIPPPLWATETTYPSGPTAGDVCKVQPVGDLVLPGVKTPAEYSNYNFNLWTKAFKTAYDRSVSVALGNWTAVTLMSGISGEPTGSVYWTQFGWDNFYNRWLGCIFSNDGTNNHVNVETTYDGGRTWSNIFTSTSSSAISIPIAFAVGSFGNNTSVAIASGSSTATAHAIAPDASTDTTTTLAGPASVGTAYAIHNTATTGNFFTYYCNQTSGTFTGHFQYADVTGVTWGAYGTALPTGWASGTNHVGAILSCTGPQDAVNSQALIAMCGTTAGTDTPRLLWHQTGGTLFTDVTPSFVSPTGNIQQITGIAYSVNDALWGVVGNNGGGGESFMYTSPDLINWTLVYTNGVLGGIQGLSVVGSVWAFTIYTGLSYNLLISGNVASAGASATWHPASFNVAVTTPGKGGLFTNGNQMLAAASNTVCVSDQVGFI